MKWVLIFISLNTSPDITPPNTFENKGEFDGMLSCFAKREEILMPYRVGEEDKLMLGVQAICIPVAR